MKLRIVILSLFLLTNSLFSQQKMETWKNYKYLTGKWEGAGSGKPGEGTGYFTFKLDLEQNILVRKSHSEYPAANDKPAAIHDDLMIIYKDYSGVPGRAIYFDNENHVINYSITYPNDNDIVFTSEKISNVPTFRLTYSRIDDITVNIKFEMSQDGNNFFTYIEGKSTKVE